MQNTPDPVFLKKIFEKVFSKGRKRHMFGQNEVKMSFGKSFGI